MRKVVIVVDCETHIRSTHSNDSVLYFNLSYFTHLSRNPTKILKRNFLTLCFGQYLMTEETVKYVIYKTIFLGGLSDGFN